MSGSNTPNRPTRPTRPGAAGPSNSDEPYGHISVHGPAYARKPAPAGDPYPDATFSPAALQHVAGHHHDMPHEPGARAMPARATRPQAGAPPAPPNTDEPYGHISVHDPAYARKPAPAGDPYPDATFSPAALKHIAGHHHEMPHEQAGGAATAGQTTAGKPGGPAGGGPAGGGPAGGGPAPGHHPHGHLHIIPGSWADTQNVLINWALALLGGALMVAMASVPLDARAQAIVALTGIIVFFVVNRFHGKGVSVFLAMLSLGVSLRYIFWRATDTLGFTTNIEIVLGSLLVIAELYAVTVLVLGYFQTLWPLERKPLPLPDDVAEWPTVDLYIPTYNEPMSVVRATVLGAMSIDYPPDKLRVYILDDGKRDEFRRFAAQCGVGYITRNDNKHAKAGNLNHALTVTTGEFISVFDCDHIPTRAFLQLTLGWLVGNPRLAMVQTPHHFYSPDPFQRNLAAGTRVPAEGNLFYGLIQDGNDFWDATFFCGSCAVIRRAALAETNGFATETVTEDAHTMLKLHRKGWESAYLRIPLAAGLATERLALHIGQRMRWARGMIQIFRLDCPMFGRGLSLGQRLCYTQAMGHFFFAIPRTVFLASPLCYLLFNQNIIAASPLAIMAYAFPHVFHSVATNSRLQKNWRHSFWSEIYETVMALFLIKVVLVTVATPRRGKFNVTAKGGLLENGYFDLRAVYPNLIMAFFLIAGAVRGIVTMIFVHTETLVFQALLLNTIWAALSLVTVMAALAVGREKRQIRSRHRIRAELKVAVYLPDGRVVVGETRDLSQGGCFIEADAVEGVKPGTQAQVEFMTGHDLLIVPIKILRWEGRALQVLFQPTSIVDEAAIVAAVFGRPDVWADWANYPNDKPMVSLLGVLVSIKGLFRPRDPGIAARPSAAAAAAAAEGANAAGQPPGAPSPGGPQGAPPGAAPGGQAAGAPDGRKRRRRPLPARAAAILLAMSLSTLLAGRATAQAPGAPPRPSLPSSGLTVRPVPGQPQVPLPGGQSYTPGTPGQFAPAPQQYAQPQRTYAPPAATAVGGYAPPPGAGGYAPPPAAGGYAPSPAVGGYAASPAAGYAPPPGVAAPGGYIAGTPGLTSPGYAPPGFAAPGMPCQVATPGAAQASAPQTRRVVYTLHQLGALGPLTLRGTSELQGVQFGVRADEVVTSAELNVSGAMSPALIPEFSNDTITLNEQYVGTIPVNRDAPRFDNLIYPVSPVFFQDNNRLNFRFTGRYTIECNDPLSGLLWSIISDNTTLAMTLERLPPQRDLSRLPLPFFDSHEKQLFNLPFVLAGNPSPEALQAAGVVASWFGLLADYRGAVFPVTNEAPPDGNAVVIVVGSEHGGNLPIPQITGPTLAVVANPNDASSSLLIIAGRTGDEVAQAAEGLVLGNRAMAGQAMAVTKPEMPQRKPYDAPYWIADNRPVKLGELVDAGDLQGYGYVPGTIRVPFRTAPDLYTWRDRPFEADIRFKTPPGPIIDLAVSRLDVGINNLFLTSFPFALDSSRSLFSRVMNFWGGQKTYRVDVPVYDVFGQNDLQFFFDARPLHRGDCVAVPNDLHMVVSPDSTIDISRAYRFTQLPNLAFFVNSGFPFTRMADLSQTAVVLSDHASPSEIGTYLNLMGRIGSLTGYPATRVTVTHPDNLAQVADKDLLVIGLLKDLGPAADLLRNSPVRLTGNALSVELGNSLDSVRRIFGDQAADQRDKAVATITAAPGDASAYIVGAESPLTKRRSVVALLATQPQSLESVMSMIRDPDQAPLIQGDLSVMSGDHVSSYRVGSTFDVGHLPFWVWPSYVMRNQPVGIMVIMVFAAVLIGLSVFWTLRRRLRIRMAHIRRK